MTLWLYRCLECNSFFAIDDDFGADVSCPYCQGWMVECVGKGEWF